jgi:uncharacterized protein (TIGR03118 family)
LQYTNVVSRPFFRVMLAISAAAVLAAVAAVPADARLARGSFHQTNLVSDIPGLAAATDPNLVNPWGLSSSATSPIWVSDNGAGVSTLYRGDGTFVPLVVTIPAPGSPTGGTPTGTVFNSTASDFKVTNGTVTAKANFLFATEDGTILGWNSTVGGTSATIAADKSTATDSSGDVGAVYKGLTLGSVGSNNYLYAANFRFGTVDVFDKDFHLVTLAGSFTDPSLPSGYAPFGIQALGSQIFVTYAKQDSTKHDDVAGPGNGFVDIFGTDGTFVRRFATQGTLDSPWGLALAPSTFGNFQGDVLVGNFGDGLINAFTPAGVLRGQLKSETSAPIQIDGLWGLRFGNGGAGGDPNTLFFAAGIDGEAHGLFGTINNVNG